MAEHDEHNSPADADNQNALGQDAKPAAAASHGSSTRETRVVRNAKGRREVVEVASTGHEWDGIREYDNPLPRWWLWVFYATIVWALFYVIAYPAIPLITGNTKGVLEYTPRKEVAAEIQKFNDANAPIQAKLVETPLADIPKDAELASYSSNAGAAIFRTWCAQCHGSGAAGAPGYANLLDNDWLWGGSIDEIYTTVQHGIRSPADPDTRYSEMPRFGTDGLLEKGQISQVVEHVMALANLPHDAAQAAAGAPIYADNCAACHAADGTGDRAQGAPNLTDAVWLYGDDKATLTRIVSQGPFGVMPAWHDRLSEADIRAVSTYVHSLGGGE